MAEATIPFAQRILRLKPSATRAMADKAAQAKAAGKKVISFTTGEPDFPSPDAAKEYALKAIQDNETKYTATPGLKKLQSAIIDYYKARHGLTFEPKGVLVGAGAKPILFETIAALVDPGDEVIVTTPAWVSYVEQIDVFDGVPVLVDTTANNFMPRIEDIKAAVTDKTVAIMLNTPHNPTGAVFSREFMRELCLLAKEKGFIVINDEIYEQLTYDGTRYVNPLVDTPEARDVVLTINGVSKTYSMTGWRIGFAVGPAKLIAKIGNIQGHNTSCASSVSQWAAVGALRHAQPDADRMVAEYAKRLDYVYGEISTMPHVRLSKPKGAFYVFIDVRPCIGKTFEGQAITDDITFCTTLLEHGLVALVPGTAFMCAGFARMSYASSMEELRQGMANLRAFLEKLA